MAGKTARQTLIDRAIKNVMKQDEDAKSRLLHFENINGIGIHKITFDKVKAAFKRLSHGAVS